MKKKENNISRYIMDEDNAIKIISDGIHKYKCTLSLKEKGFYALGGTLSMLEPYSSKTMRIYDNESGKDVPASIQIHIRYAREGEDYGDLIDSAIDRGMCVLENRYQEQYRQNRETGKLACEMTIYEAELAFLLGASRAVSESASVQNRFSTSIRKFSKALPNTKIGQIKKSDLKKVVSVWKDGEGKLKELKRFIDYVENQQKMSSGFLPVIEEVLSVVRRKDNKATNERAKKDASNSDSLSYEAEKELNYRLIENKHEAEFVAVGLIKGSYLDQNEISRLKMKQVQCDPQSRMVVFLKIKRKYSGSATQDYTFPIFPFEAWLLNNYVDILKETYGEERLHDEKYLFSSDDGTTPIDPVVIKQRCKTELLRLKFGYADLLGKVDLQKSKGTEMLRKTYRVRLENICGLTRAKDEGAYIFMLHQSLGNKVQPDHYRGFTGESGREFLRNVVMQDCRFIPPEDIGTTMRKKKGNTYRTKENRREYTIYKQDNKNVQQGVFDLVMKPDDVYILSAEHGCEVCVEEVEVLGELM